MRCISWTNHKITRFLRLLDHQLERAEWFLLKFDNQWLFRVLSPSSWNLSNVERSRYFAKRIMYKLTFFISRLCRVREHMFSACWRRGITVTRCRHYLRYLVHGIRSASSKQLNVLLLRWILQVSPHLICQVRFRYSDHSLFPEVFYFLGVLLVETCLLDPYIVVSSII